MASTKQAEAVLNFLAGGAPGAGDLAVIRAMMVELHRQAEATEAALAAGRAEGEAAGRAAPRPLGDHDARNILRLAGDSIKDANITSPAGKAALARFEALPRVEVEGGLPRNTPERIDALVAVINECHEIWSEWHDGLLSREEAETYVRRHGARR